MSTRALVAIYENGKLKATYFHHCDGYVSWLGNMLRTFANIVGHNMNDTDNLDRKLKVKEKNEIVKSRSGLEMLKPLFEIENGFSLETNFDDWWCLEYIYRINFVYDPKESYFKWDTTLEYTTEIAPVDNTWKTMEKFTPLVCYEGVHYITESDHPIPTILYGKVKSRELPAPPVPITKPEPEPKPKKRAKKKS